MREKISAGSAKGEKFWGLSYRVLIVTLFTRITIMQAKKKHRDAVLFSDQAEQVFQEHGLDAFSQTEQRSANEPLPGGPFKNVLAALHRIQQSMENPPVRTALITARSAPAHERVIKTLRAWDIRIDESYFLGGMDKGEFLRTFGADIFFDDQRVHCDSATEHVPTGHVPHGVVNE